MSKATDVRVRSVQLYFLPVQTRVPLKFGPETLTSVTCARAGVTVEDRRSRRATGWGETPLSVQWVWPGTLAYAPRHERLKAFCQRLALAWSEFPGCGHPIELGHDFQEAVLPGLWRESNAEFEAQEAMPWLAALVCCSVLDQALHDAYGNLSGRPTYATYSAEFMNRDLATFLEPAAGTDVTFGGAFPDQFLIASPDRRMRAWHLVGGLDRLSQEDPGEPGPEDGHPSLLPDWIRADGLKCLKVKLRGNDLDWDYERLVRVGNIAMAHEVEWLSTDFNCTVTDPAYVNAILDRLRDEHPRLYGMILYVEQPFPYELESNRIDVHSVSARKPLFLDESAHDWRLIRLGRELGWSGVALKTCKTQTGAILSACWARAHGMTLMVQDLTNPMLAQIPHLLLGAHVGTIMGVETNSMQFYPDASQPEAAIHPGIYRRRDGMVDLATLGPTGFGYRLEDIDRKLPAPVMESQES
jgi:L-alanine-DL-glutamate epimerase-like enolase superfamily enzyme